MNITWATAVYNRGGHTVTMLLPAGRGWWPGYLSCDDISNEYWTLTHAWLPFQGKGEERTESQLSIFLMVWGHSPHITWPTQTLTINTESSLLSPISSLIDSQRRTKRETPHLLPQPLGGGVGLWCASPLSLCFPCEQRESAGYISYVLYYISLYEQYDILYICRGREEGG